MMFATGLPSGSAQFLLNPASYKSSFCRILKTAMVNTVPTKASRSILPFSRLSKDRREPFTKDAERAAIFCLAEMERGKGGRLPLKQQPEDLAFIAEIAYPFWLVSVDETSLLLDGLNTTSHVMTYPAIPDTQAFLNAVNQSSKTRQTYQTFLLEYAKYFQVQGSQETKTILGLVSNPHTVAEFVESLHEATPITALSDVVTISPTLDLSAINSITEDLQRLRSKLQSEIDDLFAGMRFLDTTTRTFLKTVENEINEIEEQSRREIEKLRASASRDTAKIREEYNGKMADYSNRVERELLNLRRGKIRLEKEKEMAAQEVEQCEAETKTCAINKDEVGERRWRDKKNGLKGQLSETDKELKDLNKRTKELEDEKKLEIFELRSERDEKIKAATKDITEIESSKVLRIRIHREEMEKLEELTSSLIGQMDDLAKKREESTEHFRSLGTVRKGKERELVFIPFYLASFKTGSSRRYSHFSPSAVRSLSLTTRFRGTLGTAKIKRLLQPRMKSTGSFLHGFLQLIEQNPIFRREIDEASTKVNILRATGSRESIKIGLEKLKEEGWFSEREFEQLNELLY